MSVESTTEAAAARASALAAEAEKALTDFARKADSILRDGLSELRARTGDYADVAGEGFESARDYMIDRVQERPVVSTFAALGLGVLIGFVLAGRKS
jgi:ElaB/YqjD/DUF883 family membrane-anchored ribosome-binding protein